MMRRALEEDQYSALGSVVDTDSSDDEDYNPRRGVGKPILNRNTLLVAMKRHMRMEAMNTLNNFDGKSFLEDAEEYVERGGKASSSFVVNKSPTVLPDNNDEEELDVNGRRIGKRRKKKKQNRRGGGGNAFMNTPDAGIGGQGVGSGGIDDDGGAGGGIDSSAFDDDSLAEDAEISIFGQTAGSSNATWVECDRCKKVRNTYRSCLFVTNFDAMSSQISHIDHNIIYILSTVETPTRSSRCSQTSIQMVLFHEQKRS